MLVLTFTNALLKKIARLWGKILCGLTGKTHMFLNVVHLIRSAVFMKKRKSDRLLNTEVVGLWDLILNMPFLLKLSTVTEQFFKEQTKLRPLLCKRFISGIVNA